MKWKISFLLYMLKMGATCGPVCFCEKEKPSYVEDLWLLCGLRKILTFSGLSSSYCLKRALLLFIDTLGQSPKKGNLSFFHSRIASALSCIWDAGTTSQEPNIWQLDDIGVRFFIKGTDQVLLFAHYSLSLGLLFPHRHDLKDEGSGLVHTELKGTESFPGTSVYTQMDGCPINSKRPQRPGSRLQLVAS